MTSNILNKYDNIILGTGNVLAKEEYKKANSPTHEVKIEIMRVDKQIKL